MGSFGKHRRCHHDLRSAQKTSAGKRCIGRRICTNHDVVIFRDEIDEPVLRDHFNTNIRKLRDIRRREPAHGFVGQKRWRADPQAAARPPRTHADNVRRFLDFSQQACRTRVQRLSLFRQHQRSRATLQQAHAHCFFQLHHATRKTCLWPSGCTACPAESAVRDDRVEIR
ncbi:hypothetical protein ASG35_22595 [Burkholderia sp. Leaf177]|nr:hypothetical protein ASG35_22595 [Burkholderia sp. Leaf177]